MFWNNDKKANGLGGAAVTIIGPGVSVKGNVAFSGYLRVQGEIVGNVTCDSDTQGTIVIHGPGSVTGAIHAPNIVVGGRVDGPLHATESVEIHDGATVTGDVRYKRLAIQSGGTLNGALLPTVAPAAELLKQERRVAVSDAPMIKGLDGAQAHQRRATDRFWTPRKLAIAAALLVGIVVMLWPSKMPTDSAPPVAVAPGSDTPPRTDTEDPAVQAKATEPPVVAPGSVAPESRVETKSAPVTAPQSLKPDLGKVIAVEGMDVDKPSGFFFVNTREPAVLFQKQRDGAGDGTRLELGRGAQRRFPITEREVVRVAEGTNLDMYYQGRKIPPHIVRGGNWIAFVPLVPKDEAQ